MSEASGLGFLLQVFHHDEEIKQSLIEKPKPLASDTEVFYFKPVRVRETYKIEFTGKRDRFDENDMFYKIDIKFIFLEKSIFYFKISRQLIIKSSSRINSSNILKKKS